MYLHECLIFILNEGKIPYEPHGCGNSPKSFLNSNQDDFQMVSDLLLQVVNCKQWPLSHWDL